MIEKEYTTDEHGPVYCFAALGGTPTEYRCITWQGACVHVTLSQLKPFPMKGAMPDWSVRGVAAINDLVVDITELAAVNSRARSRSPLYPKLLAYEREGAPMDDRPDANFTGTLEEWDDRVFKHAVKFRLRRINPSNVVDTCETTSFAKAMVIAHDVISQPGWRVVVYAVTETGRHQALVPARWDHYAKLWLMKQAES